LRRMKDFAFFVYALAFESQIGGVFMELFEMRPDFADVGAMRGKVERVVLESVEFLLEGRMLSHQVAMRGSDVFRHHITLAHIDHVSRSSRRDKSPPSLGVRRFLVLAEPESAASFGSVTANSVNDRG
jgi:hypothetical protein